MASLIQALWRVSVLDIETTLRCVCSRVLGYKVADGHDNILEPIPNTTAADQEIYVARAKGMSELGKLFMTAS